MSNIDLPIVEIIKSFIGKELGSSIVEIRIEFMDNTLKSQDRK